MKDLCKHQEGFRSYLKTLDGLRDLDMAILGELGPVSLTELSETFNLPRRTILREIDAAIDDGW